MSKTPEPELPFEPSSGRPLDQRGFEEPEPDQDNSGTSAAEGIAVDAAGNIYGAEVGPRAVKKYVRK